MQYSNRQWSVTDRNKFITVLTETGNPATAAAAIGKTLAAVYAMRDRSPLLADAWRRALGIAWEQVEMRMLSTLLDGDAGTIDPKVALEMLKRRPAAPARQLLTIDAARIATVRSEIKALAVSGSERIPGLPNVPTVTEFNADLDPNGVIGNSWHGLFTPVGTPDDIVNLLNVELVKIVKTDAMQARLHALGLTPTGTSGAMLASKMSSDNAYWGKLINELGIKIE